MWLRKQSHLMAPQLHVCGRHVIETLPRTRRKSIIIMGLLLNRVQSDEVEKPQWSKKEVVCFFLFACFFALGIFTLSYYFFLFICIFEALPLAGDHTKLNQYSCSAVALIWVVVYTHRYSAALWETRAAYLHHAPQWPACFSNPACRCDATLNSTWPLIIIIIIIMLLVSFSLLTQTSCL